MGRTWSKNAGENWGWAFRASERSGPSPLSADTQLDRRYRRKARGTMAAHGNGGHCALARPPSGPSERQTRLRAGAGRSAKRVLPVSWTRRAKKKSASFEIRVGEAH